jgi:hypothetical protein
VYRVCEVELVPLPVSVWRVATMSVTGVVVYEFGMMYDDNFILNIVKLVGFVVDICIFVKSSALQIVISVII